MFTGTVWLGTQDYSAQQDRMFAVGLWFCQGVLPAAGADPQAALRVSPGSGLSVSIQAGWAVVQGDDLNNQGLYADYNDGMIADFGNPFGAPGGSPRVDLVCAQILDSEAIPGATPADQMEPVWVRGSEQAGADPANQAFWPAVPNTSLLLATVLVAPGQSSYPAGNIIDQRKLSGPAVWGEDGHRYRLGIDDNGNFGMEQIQ